MSSPRIARCVAPAGSSDPGSSTALLSPCTPPTASGRRTPPFARSCTRRSSATALSWLAVQQHSRVCGQVAKGLLLCTVEGGEDALDSPGGLEHLAVSTLSLSPWSAAKEHAQLSK